MLRKLTAALAFCLLFSLAAVAPAARAAGTAVTFDSPELQTALEQLTGVKPVTQEALSKLDGELNLQGKNISSAEGLQYATHIDRLVLTGNRLTDIAPVLKLTGLKRLSVNYNAISDLAGISALSKLEELNISNNPLGALPYEVCSIASLRWLYAEDIGMSALPGSISTLTALDRLDLSGNLLTATQGLETFQKLTLLDLSRCGLQAVPAELEQLKALQFLYISGNRLLELPEWLANLPLERLDVSGNFLTDLPQGFGGMKTLKQLILSHNAFFRLPDAVSKLSNLEVLMATSNFISELPADLKKLTKIYRMSFAANDLTSLASINGMKINYSWQVNFRYNHLNLDESATKAALKSFHHDGLPQKGQVTAQVASADTAGVAVEFAFNEADNAALTTGGYTIGEPLLFRKEEGGYRLVGIGETGKAAVTDTENLQQGTGYEYLAALPLVLNRQEPVTVYLTSEVKTEPLAAAPTPTPEPTPTPVEPTPQASAAVTPEASAAATPEVPANAPAQPASSTLKRTVALFAGIGFAALVSLGCGMLFGRGKQAKHMEQTNPRSRRPEPQTERRAPVQRTVEEERPAARKPVPRQDAEIRPQGRPIPRTDAEGRLRRPVPRPDAPQGRTAPRPESRSGSDAESRPQQRPAPRGEGRPRSDARYAPLPESRPARPQKPTAPRDGDRPTQRQERRPSPRPQGRPDDARPRPGDRPRRPPQR